MNKNLNPLDWTKKQQIIGGVVAIVLIGGVTTGIVANANHKAEVRKIEQLKKDKVEKSKVRDEKAKQLEKSNEADSKKLLDIAEKTPTVKNIKLAEDSILKVKNADVKKAFDNQVVGIKSRVKLENEAKTAVSNYQKDAMNNDKYKAAQQAVNKLTSSYSKGLKDSLNKQLETSKKQADDATKAQQAMSDSKAKATNTNKEQSSSTGNATNNSNNANAGTDSQSTVNNDVARGSNYYSGGSQNSSSQNNSNSSINNQAQNNSGQNTSNANSNTNSNNNNSGGGDSGQPTQPSKPASVWKYRGWVSVDGVRVYQQIFDTPGEAGAWAQQMFNSSDIIQASFDGKRCNFGTEPVQVN